ncbi:MAG: methionyl-tRNA formyltransferase, partial [Caldimonas sp.]
MRIVFAGTPEFARVALAQIHAAGFEIALVMSQPDRPAGRGLKLVPSPVKTFALDHGIAVAQPRSLRLEGRFAEDARAARVALASASPDAMVVAAYGLILPQDVLDLPRHGCLNIHASLLPRWRGAAPIQRAIEAGDAQTGITLMQMDLGLDTGPILLAKATPIADADTAATLTDRLAVLGAALCVEGLQAIAAGRPPVPRPQPEDGVTYAAKIDKTEAAVDWREPAATIERR